MRHGIEVVALVAVAGAGCSGAEEAARLSLPVVVDGAGMTPVHTDQGYEVTLTEARLVVDDLQFSIAGEAHAGSFWRRSWDLVVPRAHAHPGHYEGGDVTGELRGHFVLELRPEATALLGMAELIVGVYRSANFTFGKASRQDGLSEDDPLLGHTALLVGVAARDGQRFPFSVALDAPESRQLVGAPFEVELTKDSRSRLELELLTLDPVEGDTLFDGIDFAALPLDARGQMSLDATNGAPAMIDAYNTLRGAFMTHDHFQVSASLD